MPPDMGIWIVAALMKERNTPRDGEGDVDPYRRCVRHPQEWGGSMPLQSRPQKHPQRWGYESNPESTGRNTPKDVGRGPENSGRIIEAPPRGGEGKGHAYLLSLC